MAADERPISDFPRLTSILTTALLFTSVVTGVDSYDSRSVTTEVLARAILGDFQYSEIDAQTVFDRINQIKVLSDNAAPTAADGSENQIFVQIDGTGSTDEIDAIFVKYSGSWLEVPYQKSSDNNLQTNDKTIVGAINELKSEKADKSTLLSGSTNPVSVPAYTAQTLHSENVTPGNYIVSCSIEFSSANTTGTRRIGIITSLGDVASSEMAAFNGYAAMNISGAFKTTANTTVSFFCRHSADAALPVKIVVWSIVKVD